MRLAAAWPYGMYESRYQISALRRGGRMMRQMMSEKDKGCDLTRSGTETSGRLRWASVLTETAE